MSRKTVVIDTNCWISSYLTPNGNAGKATALALQNCTIIHSPETLDELKAVLSRQKFDRVAPISERIAFYENIALLGTLIQPMYKFQVFTDPSDDKFLDLAYAGGADYIISGDATHLQPRKHVYGIQMWSPAQFLRL